MGWTDPFSDQQIPVSNATLQVFDLTALSSITLSWSQNSEPNPLATNDIFINAGASVKVYLPTINSGPVDAAFYLINQSSNTLGIYTSANTLLYSLPQYGVIEMILSDPFAGTQADGWTVVPMNIGNSVISNLSSVASPTIRFDSDVGTLNTQVNSILITDGSAPTISEYSGYDSYTVDDTPVDFTLPTPSNGDIGKLIGFKNLSSGTANVIFPANTAADIGTADASTPGYTSIALNYGEALTLLYVGTVVKSDTSVWNMFIIEVWEKNTGALYLDTTILLAPTPPSDPVEFTTSQVNSDVIYFSATDLANPPVGSYFFTVTNPVAKIYYFTLDSVAENATVTVTFGNTVANNFIVISPSSPGQGGFYQCFVANNGEVVLSVSVLTVTWATQSQVNAGIANNLGVTPLTLAGNISYIFGATQTPRSDFFGWTMRNSSDTTKISTVQTKKYNSGTVSGYTYYSQINTDGTKSSSVTAGWGDGGNAVIKPLFAISADISATSYARFAASPSAISPYDGLYSAHENNYTSNIFGRQELYIDSNGNPEGTLFVTKDNSTTSSGITLMYQNGGNGVFKPYAALQSIASSVQNAGFFISAPTSVSNYQGLYSVHSNHSSASKFGINEFYVNTATNMYGSLYVTNDGAGGTTVSGIEYEASKRPSSFGSWSPLTKATDSISLLGDNHVASGTVSAGAQLAIVTPNGSTNNIVISGSVTQSVTSDTAVTISVPLSSFGLIIAAHASRGPVSVVSAAGAGAILEGTYCTIDALDGNIFVEAVWTNTITAPVTLAFMIVVDATA